ncbi:MAG: phosphoesterase [Eubacteriales bacterium]|nr:phosphoesterase [Eubacteriales bacterium]
MRLFIQKYKHGFLMLSYAIIYILCFRYLEARPVRVFHVVHTVFDDMIPFCEYFIIPYLLWFPYMIGAVVYFVFKNPSKKEYYQLSLNLIMGMTIFLIVSYVFPNIQHLRPTEFTHSNIFVTAVQHLYMTDTPTNILPSIHVFNSFAIHRAIHNSELFQDRPAVRYGSFTLTVLIILSTMFLKQHSVIDVCMGTTLALFGDLLFYSRRVQSTALSIYERSLSWSRRKRLPAKTVKMQNK